MKVIGITGGVGSGKSALLSYIKEKYNCEIILADEAAHRLKEPGQPCYDKLVELLTEEILDEDGMINKAKMAAKIFQSEKLLENLCLLLMFITGSFPYLRSSSFPSRLIQKKPPRT